MAIAYRSNKVAAQQTLRQLQATGVDCVAVETDSPMWALRSINQDVADRFGRLDVIVTMWVISMERCGIVAAGLQASHFELLTVVHVPRRLRIGASALGPNHQFGRRRPERAFRQAKISACRCQAAVVALSRFGD